MKPVICNYCENEAKLVTGEVIYPHRSDLFHKYFWHCGPCNAYVGTHQHSKEHKPLGRLADAALREKKKTAHSVFDPLWRGGAMSRKQAYRWLAGQLGIPPKRTHIGDFDIPMCNRVISACAGKKIIT